MVRSLVAKHLTLPHLLAPPPLNFVHRHVSTTMEVEVKLRLPDAATHQTVLRLLSPYHTQTLIQENIFFDGANDEFLSNFAALRLRFYGGDSRCVLSLKSKPSISAGISRIEEQEEPFDVSLGRASIPEPWRLLSVATSQILKRVKDKFGVGELICLGGFRNVRSIFNWEGFKLEVDETHYDFGTSYEIECESLDPDRAKKLIEGFLGENGISYSFSEMNKFAVFRSGKLPV